MTIEKMQNIWIWLMTVEDSSRWGANKARPLTSNKKSMEFIPSIAKVIFWYGIALSFSLFISKLH
jgi:hypothetical protein